MTYCVGMMLEDGLVLVSDTRTNSGVDNVSTFRKMFSWHVPGDRIITVMTAGNLATTQAVVSQLEERAKAPAERHPSILEAPTMFQVARIAGQAIRDTIAESSGQQGDQGTFGASIILAGQIKGIPPRLFMIYPEGNFIEASPETPFFQIGETKYGRPIVVRAYRPDMTLEEALRLILVSFDSTLRANLSVGLPLDIQVIPKDALRATHERRIEESDKYFRELSTNWGTSLRAALAALPPYPEPVSD
ncbi:MAG: proteasome-type protease [Acidimicrobiales bacterium]|nr:proteasome-type protease [Acidimicrobiales bacterium]